MVSAIGGLVFNTMPLLLASLSDRFAGDSAPLGHLALWAGLGYLAGTLSCPLWVERVNWRRTSYGIVGCAALSFWLTSHADGVGLTVSFLTFGFFCALAIALAMRALAEQAIPERAFGIRLAVELLFIGVFLALLPVYFIEKYGFSGAMYGLVAACLLLGVGAFLMPESGQVSEVPHGFPSWPQTPAGWSLLGLFLIFLLANIALFFFLAILAEQFSPAPAQIGVMFAVLKWLGGVAGLLGAWLGVRLGVFRPHYGAFILLAIGLVMLAFASSFHVFMVGAWVWEFGFTLACLYLTAAIKRADDSHTLVMWIPAAFGIAMLAGGWLGGQILTMGTPHLLYGFVLICAALPSVYIYLKKPF